MNKHLVVQHNKIVEAKYKLSVGEQRLIKLLVSMIDKDDEDFKPYRISVGDLSRLLELSDNDFYRKVENIAKKLISNVLVFRDENGNTLQVAWLSSAEYIKSKGMVELEFSPKLKPFLLQLKAHFTAYELANVIRLKHTYSIRIYELLKQYERIGRRKFSVDDLRELLMMGEDEYRQFSDFRKRVLRGAQQELAEKTDIAFSWQEEKEGRKCVAIEFIIKPRKQREEKAAISLQAAGPEPPEARDEAPEPSPAAAALTALGVARKTAEALAKEYDAARIAQAIAYAQAQRQAGKLKNLAGFVVKAIEDGYQDGQAEERQRKDKAAKAAASEESRRKQWRALKARWEDWRQARVEAHLAALDPEALERERAAFRDSLAGNFALTRLVGKSAESAALHFRLHLAGSLPGLGIEDWARSAGVDLGLFRELARAESPL